MFVLQSVRWWALYLIHGLTPRGRRDMVGSCTLHILAQIFRFQLNVTSIRDCTTNLLEMLYIGILPHIPLRSRS